MKVKMDKQGKGKKKENVLNLWKMILTTIYRKRREDFCGKRIERIIG